LLCGHHTRQPVFINAHVIIKHHRAALRCDFEAGFRLILLGLPPATLFL
jgi:hypothetical protein